MPLYHFRAANQQGRVIKSRLDCLNAFELEMRLQQQGLEMLQYRLAFSELAIFRRGVSRKDLINFCFQLEQLTQAGIPIIDGLKDLYQDSEPGQFKQMIASLSEDTQAGIGFSGALKRHPQIFDDVFVSLVATGELSGNLPEIFKRLGQNLKWLDELLAQIKKILIYPVFTLIVIFAVFLFLMLFLVPQLAGFMQNMNVELPFQTRVLLSTSELCQQYWLEFLFVMVGSPILFFWVVRRSNAVKIFLDRLVFKVPYIGNIVSKIILARFTSMFALLYGSGINILQAMQMLRFSSGNHVVVQNLILVEQFIIDGKPVSEAFRLVDFFPRLVIRMLKIGEATGKLDDALNNNASYFYFREVQEGVAKIQNLIGPVLTVLLGGILGWLMLAVLGPLYELLEKIKL